MGSHYHNNYGRLAAFSMFALPDHRCARGGVLRGGVLRLADERVSLVTVYVTPLEIQIRVLQEETILIARHVVGLSFLPVAVRSWKRKDITLPPHRLVCLQLYIGASNSEDAQLHGDRKIWS